MSRCFRCGETRTCREFDGAHVCDACVSLIIREFLVKREEFGELIRS